MRHPALPLGSCLVLVISCKGSAAIVRAPTDVSSVFLPSSIANAAGDREVELARSSTVWNEFPTSQLPARPEVGLWPTHAPLQSIKTNNQEMMQNWRTDFAKLQVVQEGAGDACKDDGGDDEGANNNVDGLKRLQRKLYRPQAQDLEQQRLQTLLPGSCMDAEWRVRLSPLTWIAHFASAVSGLSTPF